MCTLKIAHIIIDEFQTASVWTPTTSGFWDFGKEAAEVNFETSLQWGHYSKFVLQSVFTSNTLIICNISTASTASKRPRTGIHKIGINVWPRAAAGLLEAWSLIPMLIFSKNQLIRLKGIGIYHKNIKIYSFLHLNGLETASTI